jgi:membrane protein implicated in regulation of membrane protease activity
MVLAWLIIGALLLLFEMHHVAFFAMFGAIGSFAAAVVAALAPEAVPLQVGVGLGVTAVGLVAGRPFVSRAFDMRHHGYSVKGVHGGLVGHEAVTLDEVGDVHRIGHVRLTGERWLAVCGSGEALPAGTAVVVTAVQGTTLVVLPVDALGVVPLALPDLVEDLADDLADTTDADPAGPAGATSDSEDAPDGADGRRS